MKLIMWIILTAIYICSVLAQTTPPPDVDTALAQKIQQEHATTRQFLSQEMDKKIQAGMTEFTKRADYYEKSYQNIQNTTLLKLGMFWAGIYLFLSSFMYYLRTKTEKKRYAVLKDTIATDVRKDVLAEFQGKFTQLPNEVMSPYSAQSMQPMKSALQKIFRQPTAETPSQQPSPQAHMPVGAGFPNLQRPNPQTYMQGFQQNIQQGFNMPLPPQPTLNLSPRKLKKMQKKLNMLNEDRQQMEIARMKMMQEMGMWQ
ncbi:MAG: hypothetical protein MUP55_03545 [Candidatus Aenigmarchaeota archaeon]|nr:hypothetical protein [Candidatus Aenigmarchaeota archaeon]